LPAAVEAAARYHAGGMSLSVATPRLRGRIHQVAFFVSIPMGITVVLLASGAAATAVAAVYAASLTAVFGTSAAYHRGRWGPRARRWMKRLDHSMIYVLIAGSYTPVAVLALHGPWEVVLLSVAWAGAAVGITMKMARPDGLSVLSAILYMAMGWLALVAIPPLVRGMPPAGLVLMVAGGLLYTAGAIVFASRRPDPRPAVFGYHEIWHAFMVAAAACHYVMILLVLRAS
jgi:hemolysin III